MSDFDDDQPDASTGDPAEPPVTNAEGVRILGAEEAQAAVEGQGRMRPEDAPRRRTQPPPGTQPAARFPLPPGTPASSIPAPRPTPAPEPSGPIPLPHWTEPPTGEVPQIPGDESDPDLGVDEPWAAGGGPRFRADVGSWDDTDFGGDEPLHDDTTALGALVDLPEIDEDEVFAAEVEAKRAPERRVRSRAQRGARSSRAGAAAGASATAAPAYPGTDDLRGSAPARPERDDLTTRIITGVVLAAVALLCFAIGRAATAVLVTVIVTAAAFELYEGLRRAGFQPATLIGLLGCVSIVGVAYNYGERAFALVTALVVVFSLLWYLAKVVNARPMVNVAVTLLGYTYVGVLGGFAGLMLVAPDGVGILIGLVICAIGYDVAGYFVGSRMGRRSLAPEWSPNKTMEGLFAGMGAAVLLGAVVAVVGITPWDSFSDGLLLGIVVAIFAPLGDLCESMLKRDLGLKDFGTMLPGHGGVLDRFDAILFCLPAVYYLVLALGLS
ncbi:MAG TPA: phosphatidate cytidylyltransferase [Acidimicrobiia bacterium]|nr:phosphatidate cytidylyltransferase [Acidimicrobiia bacterium]